jgi:drug/metabolite transporter (DMT)-like permease
MKVIEILFASALCCGLFYLVDKIWQKIEKDDGTSGVAAIFVAVIVALIIILIIVWNLALGPGHHPTGGGEFWSSPCP